MNYLYKISTFIIIAFSISACTPKLTVKSLYPSKMHNEKIHTVHIENFLNDDINQKNQIEEEISNKYINNKKVFTLTNNKNSDIIINGEVLESSIFYESYYKKEIDYSRCVKYKYHKKHQDKKHHKKKDKECIKYRTVFIPCEVKDYNVVSKVRVLQPRKQTILFTKTYNKSQSINKCFRRNISHYRYTRDKFNINAKLAKEIAYNVLEDISPHYVYFNLEIIDELENSDIYSKEIEEKFELASELIEKQRLKTAQNILKELNVLTKNKSWEILYNLGLTYEGMSKLYEANKYYSQAKSNINEIDNLILLDKATLRTQINLEEKIKVV